MRFFERTEKFSLPRTTTDRADQKPRPRRCNRVLQDRGIPGTKTTRLFRRSEEETGHPRPCPVLGAELEAQGRSDDAEDTERKPQPQELLIEGGDGSDGLVKGRQTRAAGSLQGALPSGKTAHYGAAVDQGRLVVGSQELRRRGGFEATLRRDTDGPVGET